MTSISSTTEKLRSLIGSRVDRIGFLIWPDPVAPEHTDVRLYLEVTSIAGNTRGVTLSTDADGQSPACELGILDGGISLSKLESRKEDWRSDKYWQTKSSYSYELFLISPDSDSHLATVCEQSVTRGFLICFADDQDIATGVVLEFANGQQVWSVPSTYGNSVKSVVTDDLWPDPVLLHEI